ncbi:MAG TPA: response regulator [Arachidicoccus sp.]|nr:response regulator [Arachidicoccus sp.]
MEHCILIYEDDRELLELCRIILSKPGRKIETFNRCENILEDVRQYQPDLILMDLWIPEIGGEKAISLVKEVPENDHIAVILFSANTEIAEICSNLGADDYLKKPFDLANFRKTVEKHLLN